jgi:hypothetical protein
MLSRLADEKLASKDFGGLDFSAVAKGQVAVFGRRASSSSSRGRRFRRPREGSWKSC